MENWETCVFFCVSPIPLVVTNQVEGVGYAAAHLQQKSPFYFQKTPSHTHSYSVSHVRGSIARHISIQQFSEKNRKYQINFDLYNSSPEGSISLQHLF